MSVDSDLPVPPEGGVAQQEYDRQVVANVVAGDHAGLARLKGTSAGFAVAAGRDETDLTLIRFAVPALGDTGTIYFGDGVSQALTGEDVLIEHTYPGAGFWGAVVVAGDRTGVCVVETGDAPVLLSRKGKK